MMRPDAKVEKVYLYPKPVDFRKSIDGLAALVELDIKVAVFDPVLFVFLNKPRNRVKILYWERNGFCLWLKRLESERFKTSPDPTDVAIVLTAEVSEQLEIVPMQIRVIKHVRKVYGCRDYESAPVTADKPAQMIEKSTASPSVLAMLLTTNT